MKKINYFLSVLILSAFISSCGSSTVIFSDKEKPAQERYLQDIPLNGKVYSALWQQNSGEFRALCYQAYNLATAIVEDKSSRQHFRPIAIVTDIDETIIDNSPYAVTQALRGNEYDKESWTEWTSKGEAIAYPGAVEFFQYAASRNVNVFYVTNRYIEDLEGTIKNLKDLGFPNADKDHVIVKTTTSSKEERRQKILKDYEVFMYLGDNLTDFHEVFDNTTQDERNQKVDELSSEFGKTFIVLPNSGYGDWEGAIPGYNYQFSPKEKDSIILKAVKGY